MLSPSRTQPEPLNPAARSRPQPPTSIGRVRGPIRLPAPRRIGVYVVSAAVWMTGLLWLVFHYFLQRDGEFGREPNPLEPWWLKLHGAAAFGALWIFGLLWGVHVLNGWSAGRRRWSGGALFAAFALLIVSGYLLYYAGDEGLRDVVGVAHWVIGLGAPAAFIWHRYFAREAK